MPLCSFDIVTCCDVLEHVEDLERVVSGIGRVLAPGGVFFYDTVNGTMQSRVMMKVMQDWVRVAPKDLHDWARFITPDELRRLLARHGLENREPRGLQPTGNPLAMFPLVRKLKRGEITYRRDGPAHGDAAGQAARGVVHGLGAQGSRLMGWTPRICATLDHSADGTGYVRPRW